MPQPESAPKAPAHNGMAAASPHESWDYVCRQLTSQGYTKDQVCVKVSFKNQKVFRSPYNS